MQLNAENFEVIKSEIINRNDLTLWVNAIDVSGFKNLNDTWEQISHPPMYDAKHFVEAVHYAHTSIDSFLTYIAYQVEQVEPIGTIEYKSGSDASRIDIRISWPQNSSGI